jgi:hypothetical protein
MTICRCRHLCVAMALAFLLAFHPEFVLGQGTNITCSSEFGRRGYRDHSHRDDQCTDSCFRETTAESEVSCLRFTAARLAGGWRFPALASEKKTVFPALAAAAYASDDWPSAGLWWWRRSRQCGWRSTWHASRKLQHYGECQVWFTDSHCFSRAHGAVAADNSPSSCR